jgi:hypothetical protein
VSNDNNTLADDLREELDVARRDSLALMKLLADEKRKSERIATELAWHQKVLARAVQFDWITSRVPEDLAVDVLNCMDKALSS